MRRCFREVILPTCRSQWSAWIGTTPKMQVVIFLWMFWKRSTRRRNASKWWCFAKVWTNGLLRDAMLQRRGGGGPKVWTKGLCGEAVLRTNDLLSEAVLQCGHSSQSLNQLSAWRGNALEWWYFPKAWTNDLLSEVMLQCGSSSKRAEPEICVEWQCFKVVSRATQCEVSCWCSPAE